MVGVVAVALLFVGALAVGELAAPGGAGGRTVRVTKTFFDGVDAPAGYAFYVLELNVTNAGSAPWVFTPGALQITGNKSHLYQEYSSYNVTSVLDGFTLNQGGQKAGMVAFELPAGEGPSTLRYDDVAGGVSLDSMSVPAVSSVASKFDFQLRLSVNGIPVEGWTDSSCTAAEANGTGPWVCSLIANGVVQNNTLVFFTGQTVQVNLWFEYLKKPADPGTITLESVANQNGFEVLDSRPAVPQAMTGWAAQGGVVVLLKVPPEANSGPIRFSVQFSG